MYSAEISAVQLNVFLHVHHVATTQISYSNFLESSLVALPVCIHRGKTTGSKEVIIRVSTKLTLGGSCVWKVILEGGVRRVFYL